jgi:protein involved in temperature-dependent protein secretion
MWKVFMRTCASDVKSTFKKKMKSNEIMSSVRLSVRYSSAGIAPRELKLCTEVRWCVWLNSTVRDLGSVALGQSLSVISLKNITFFETSVILLSQKSKNVLPISVTTWNFLFIFYFSC